MSPEDFKLFLQKDAKISEEDAQILIDGGFDDLESL